MSKERLSLDEVKRIAIEFAQNEWGGDVTGFKSIWRSPIDELRVEVEGIVRIHQSVPTEPGKYIDTIVECPFKLDISEKDGKVRGYQLEKSIEQPPPVSPPFCPPPSMEPEVISLDYLKADEDLKKAEADLLKELREDIKDRRRREGFGW